MCILSRFWWVGPAAKAGACKSPTLTHRGFESRTHHSQPRNGAFLMPWNRAEGAEAMTDAATIDNAQQPQGGGFGGRPVHRTAEVWSLSSRRAWIGIGVCSVPATAWMSLSLFMSSVLRTCGDDSACAELLVTKNLGFCPLGASSTVIRAGTATGCFAWGRF